MPVSEEQKNEFLEHISQGAFQEEALKAANFTRATLMVWRKSGDPKHKDFLLKYSDATIQARKARTVMVEEALLKSAIKGNVKAQVFWLINRMPSDWKNTNHIHQTVTNNPLSEHTDEELLEIMKEQGISIAEFAVLNKNDAASDVDPNSEPGNE
ncbi:MAG: hypothetical protein DRQ46_00355 [Gammaproteobacteria bacterium]|nr:MAG: hypothetical protein DRQ46_00355 [Gammaproteobacteria bacterium]